MKDPGPEKSSVKISSCAAFLLSMCWDGFNPFLLYRKERMRDRALLIPPEQLLNDNDNELHLYGAFIQITHRLIFMFTIA